MHRHLECCAHHEQDQAQFKETDAEVRKKFPEKQSQWLDWGDEELFEGVALLLPHDRERSQERGHVQ